MAKLEDIELVFTVRVHLSLWNVFKLRLAGCKAKDIESLKKVIAGKHNRENEWITFISKHSELSEHDAKRVYAYVNPHNVNVKSQICELANKGYDAAYIILEICMGHLRSHTTNEESEVEE